jgi:cation diffusion facilitator CzcD-associated flavoprotein CzcO
MSVSMQGFTTRKKVWYARDVLHMLDEYVRVQNLEPYLRLNTEVMAHEWSDEQDRWILKASTVLLTRSLICLGP